MSMISPAKSFGLNAERSTVHRLDLPWRPHFWNRNLFVVGFEDVAVGAAWTKTMAADSKATLMRMTVAILVVILNYLLRTSALERFVMF